MLSLYHLQYSVRGMQTAQSSMWEPVSQAVVALRVCTLTIVTVAAYCATVGYLEIKENLPN